MAESQLSNQDIKSYAHKRNELKRVYQNIINLSRHLPFYKINLTKENQEYTIGIKEASLSLKAKIKALSDTDNSCFQSKALTISDEKVLTAKLVDEDTKDLPDIITISIDALASEQINKSRDLLHVSRALDKGTYKFDLNIMDETYHLEFEQNEKAENINLLIKLADYINENAPAISAKVEKGDNQDYSHLVITTDVLGNDDGITFYFEDDISNRKDFVNFLDLNNVVKFPENASFVLNGVHKQTSVNTFSVEKTLHMNLLQTSDNPVIIRITRDNDMILSKVGDVVDTYNGLIRLAKNRMEETEECFRAKKLISEMKSMGRMYTDELEACGIHVAEDGMLVIDEELASQASENGEIESLFTEENGFMTHVLEKTDTIAINPFEYLDNKIVTYPGNKKKIFTNPYLTSMYSGLFFSSYC